MICTCPRVEFCLWLDSDASVVPKPNRFARNNRHKEKDLHFQDLKAIWASMLMDRHEVSFLGYRQDGAGHQGYREDGAGNQCVGRVDPGNECPCTWIYQNRPRGQHHIFNSGAFLLRAPQCAAVLELWWRLRPERWIAELPAKHVAEEATSEQNVFDRELAARRDVQLVAQYRFCPSPGVFECTRETSLVHWYGRWRFRGKSQIKAFCRSLCENLSTAQQRDIPAVSALASDWVRVSNAEKASEERVQKSDRKGRRRENMAKARRAVVRVRKKPSGLGRRKLAARRSP